MYWFRKHLILGGRKLLERLLKQLDASQSVALLCGCPTWNECHARLIAESIQELPGYKDVQVGEL